MEKTLLRRLLTESGELILEAEALEEVRTIVGEQLDYYKAQESPPEGEIDYRKKHARIWPYPGASLQSP